MNIFFEKSYAEKAKTFTKFQSLDFTETRSKIYERHEIM